MIFEQNSQGKVEKTTLPCGLRVITEYVPSSRSVSLGLWIAVGSRDEQPGEFGCAHFLEHLLFKGTKNRSAIDIANAIDTIGGELNAFTTKENTCFYVQVLEEDVTLGLDLICDVVLYGNCKKSDIEVERQVVLDEISMQNDDPEDSIAEHVLAGLFGDSPIARPILGTKENITQLTVKDIREFYRKWYTPDRMVLSIAGNIDHNMISKEVERIFSAFTPAKPQASRALKAQSPQSNNGIFTQYKDSEQVHLALAYSVGGRHEIDKSTAMVLAAILGGGISSRLFQKIREEHGLAYSVYANLEFFTEMGMLIIYVACQSKEASKAMGYVKTILQDIEKKGVTNTEVIQAKRSLKGSLILGLEDLPSRMFRLGRHEINYGEYRDLSLTLAELDAVCKSNVNKFARKFLDSTPSMAFIGPIHGKKKRQAILQPKTKNLSKFSFER